MSSVVNPIFVMFEDAITEPVSANVASPVPGQGNGVGDQMMAAVFVAKIKDFTAGIADRIVMPRTKPELMGIFTPGVGLAILGDKGAKNWIGDHIHPRRRCHLSGRRRHHVFMAIGGESSQTVK